MKEENYSEETKKIQNNNFGSILRDIDILKNKYYTPYTTEEDEIITNFVAKNPFNISDALKSASEVIHRTLGSVQGRWGNLKRINNINVLFCIYSSKGAISINKKNTNEKIDLSQEDSDIINHILKKYGN